MRRPYKSHARAAEPDEHTIQVQLLKILTYTARPDIYYFAIPNAGRRSYRAGLAMVAEGLRKGVADLCFMFPADEGSVAWLEMKTTTGSLRTEQQGFRAICGRLGHRWAMARSVDEALAILRGWNALKANADII